MKRWIDTNFWTDPTIKAGGRAGLSPTDRLLLLYLRTAPSGHLCGLYYCPIAVMARETGLKASEVGASLNRLSTWGLVHYHPGTEMVWVVHEARRLPRARKISTAIKRQITSLHASPLVDAFLRTYDTQSGVLDWVSGEADSLTTPTPDPTVVVSVVSGDPDPPELEPGESLPLFGGVSEPKRKRRAKPADELTPEERALIARIWEEQERLRGEAARAFNGTWHQLQPSDERFKRIAERVREGNTEDQCRHVLAVYAQEAKRRGDLDWFNGESNWRRDNFNRALGKALVGSGPRAAPARDVRVGPAEPSKFSETREVKL